MYIIISIFLIFAPSLIIGDDLEMRCYSGTKFVVGQDVYQDTENCAPFFGIGESYCYKFSEESQLNEVVKLGCSAFVCNGIRNRCMETDMLGMKGTLCCCNSRHYCNSSNNFSNLPFIFIIFIALSSILL
ncbi:unnamed protein product [Caenorhabditis angaria]|uniref:UPAR/Ly6 domain-containing protein n=1 Tax=Caenorhabditis angaria TaxID=860376 RepID=A0A9P1N2W0_9PELO|nr:unnamed protein product [Caenorhabditis angaria]